MTVKLSESVVERCIYDGYREPPSDLQGVVYTDKSDWKLDVCRELKAMNVTIDFNKLF